MRQQTVAVMRRWFKTLSSKRFLLGTILARKVMYVN